MVAQLAPPLGGRGKKFRVNLTQNLKAVQAGGEAFILPGKIVSQKKE